MSFILDQNESIKFPRLQLLSNMPSSERMSGLPSAISAAGFKRCAPDEHVELQCLICLELVVDAVQVRCCGALHCRTCISKCDKCPLCRQPVSADCIIPDVRIDRMSAAALRLCPYEREGCKFKGNRSSVAAHEELCDFVPRSVLREKIQKAARDKSELSLLQMTQRCFRLIEENSAISERMKKENLEMQQALMKSALGPEPAKAALKILYNIPADGRVCEINREKAQGECFSVCNFTYYNINLGVHESNHNVAVWFSKGPNADKKHPNGFRALLFVRLLHPYDVALAKDISIQASELWGQERESWGFENFMTSKQLDEYCVNGKYYIG